MAPPADLSERLLQTSAGVAVHAVLFYGAHGSPVDDQAFRLACAWLCTNQQNGRPCEQCASCKSSAKGAHVDFRVIEPSGPSSLIRLSAISAAKAGEDREEQSLQEFFRTPPLMSGRKIVMLRRAERMNADAANSLLKILEEPPEFAKLILTTYSMGILLPTVVSRCLCVPVRLDVQNREETEFERHVREIARQVPSNGPGKAPVLSEKLRDLSAELDAKEGIGARAAQARALEELAHALLASHPHHPEYAQMAIEAHRRTMGNANSGPLFDSLFATMLAGTARKL